MSRSEYVGQFKLAQIKEWKNLEKSFWNIEKIKVILQKKFLEKKNLSSLAKEIFFKKFLKFLI